MKDIHDAADIKELVDGFYSKVKTDAVIGTVFTEVANVDWVEHLPRMYGFWETVLFGRAVFKGDPIGKHLLLAEKVALTEAHFDRWVRLWFEAIDERFAGEKASDAKSKAMVMKTLMLAKIQKRYEKAAPVEDTVNEADPDSHSTAPGHT